MRGLGARHLHAVDASRALLRGLAGVEDPEQKRRIIGDLFITVQREEIARLGITDYWLAQGTLYTDLVESGKGVGAKANVIKTHHNVRSPLVEELRARGRIVEPLSTLYKDEVRALGLALGLKREIVFRHPFPGPGLAVRILGEVTREKCDLLRRVDALFLSELRSPGPLRADLAGILRAAPRSGRSASRATRAATAGCSRCARSLRWTRSPPTSTRSRPGTCSRSPRSSRTGFPEIGRVVYDVSSKPPATIEWE